MSAIGRAVASDPVLRAAIREREARVLDAVSVWIRSRPQWADPPVTAVQQTLAAVADEAVQRAVLIRARSEDPEVAV
jgi:hypothetical protein